MTTENTAHDVSSCCSKTLISNVMFCMRRCGQLVELARDCKSNIVITANNKTATADSMLNLAGLAIGKGTLVHLTVDEGDSRVAFNACLELFEYDNEKIA